MLTLRKKTTEMSGLHNKKRKLGEYNTYKTYWKQEKQVEKQHAIYLISLCE